MRRVYFIIAGLAACVLVLGAVCIFDAGVEKGWLDAREEYRLPYGRDGMVTGVAGSVFHLARRPLPPPADVYRHLRTGRWAWFVSERGEWLYRQVTLADELGTEHGTGLGATKDSEDQQDSGGSESDGGK